MPGGLAATNGITQGSIPSPYLYNVYIYELNNVLAESGIRCSVHEKCINFQSYADGMVLVASSADAHQTLFD